MVVAVAANQAVRLRLLVLELELEFECVLDMKNKVWLHMPTSGLVHDVHLRFSDPRRPSAASTLLQQTRFSASTDLCTDFTETWAQVNHDCNGVPRLHRDVGPSQSQHKCSCSTANPSTSVLARLMMASREGALTDHVRE